MWRLRGGEKREECERDVEIERGESGEECGKVVKIERRGIVGKGVKLGVFWSKEG